ncbi:MAG: NAD(P)-dependent oxidoreductase [Candidatus Levyibacteriota bacterium]
MKCGLFELEEWEKEFFKKELTDCELIFFDAPLDANTPDLGSYDAVAIFGRNQLRKDVLDLMGNLKMIATLSTGLDHIDLNECKARSIVVSNVSGYGESTVAEHSFALLLAIARNLLESLETIKKGIFSPAGLTGFELHGKTLGIIGVGAIGTNMIRIAKGFRMSVIAYKRTPDPELEKEFDFKFVDLETLYREADVISIHIPYTPESHHFINAEAFSKMKDGVILLNTARGALVDSQALLQALDSGKVKAAGLDVLEEEPLLQEERDLLATKDPAKLLTVVEDHMLVNHPNVIVTPHNAFNSHEALEKIVSTSAANMKAFKDGTPQNVVA